MYVFLLFSILVSVYCGPVKNNAQEIILSSENTNDGSGNYKFSYSTSNGIFREEQGSIVNRGEADEHIEVRGSYSYSLPDGSLERIEYTADKNGYQYSTKTIVMDKRMHIYLSLSILLVTVYCATLKDESQATISSYDYNNDGNGNYNFSYFTSNGIFREEHGTVINKGEPNEHIQVRGSYSYLRPDGETEYIEYTGDEKGFQYSTGTPIDFKIDNPPLLVASLLG